MRDVAQAPGTAAATGEQTQWLHRRGRLAVSSVFVVYLLYVGLSIAEFSDGVGEILAYVMLGAFAALYMAAVGTRPELQERSAAWWALVGAMSVLFVAELPFARATAFVMSLYIVALSCMRFGARALPAVAALTAAALLGPTLVPSWHDSVGDDVAMATPIAIPVVGLLSVGILALLRSNRALAEARAEVARLGAEAERIRIARDLHDLLGHSLTTITVKAGLAHRIGRTDVDRALGEVAEIEQLARRSLHDVRAAVAGYREVTLTGELATGRELLRNAGVAAELPSAADIVPTVHQELFGWVVREGLTNVVRHAHADTCVVRLAPDSVEIVDDGVGPAGARVGRADGAGSGLTGLRERVVAAGGTVQAGPGDGGGWRLRVSVGAGNGDGDGRS